MSSWSLESALHWHAERREMKLSRAGRASHPTAKKRFLDVSKERFEPAHSQEAPNDALYPLLR